MTTATKEDLLKKLAKYEILLKEWDIDGRRGHYYKRLVASRDKVLAELKTQTTK